MTIRRKDSSISSKIRVVDNDHIATEYSIYVSYILSRFNIP